MKLSNSTKNAIKNITVSTAVGLATSQVTNYYCNGNRYINSLAFWGGYLATASYLNNKDKNISALELRKAQLEAELKNMEGENEALHISIEELETLLEDIQDQYPEENLEDIKDCVFDAFKETETSTVDVEEDEVEIDLTPEQQQAIVVAEYIEYCAKNGINIPKEGDKLAINPEDINNFMSSILSEEGGK